MQNRLNKTILLLILPLLLVAQTISFEDSLSLVFQNSKELRLLEISIQKEKILLGILESGDYPKLSLSLSNSMNEDLQFDPTVTFDEYAKLYSSSASLSLSYNLFDGGTLSKDKKIQKESILQKKFAIQKKRYNISLKLIKIYTDILSKQAQIKQNILVAKIDKKIYEAQKRLYNASKITKVNFLDYTVANLDKIYAREKLIKKYKMSLKQLSDLTKEEYYFDDDFMAYDIGIDLDINLPKYEDSQTYKLNQSKIQTQLLKIKKQKNSLYPKINFSSSYGYSSGESINIHKKSLRLKKDSLSASISIDLTLFEGFKYNKTMQKLKLELNSIKLQDEISKEKFEKGQKRTQKSLKMFIDEAKFDDKKLLKIEEKSKMLKRLREQRVMEYISYKQNQQKIMQTKLKYRLKKLKIKSELKKLKLQKRFNG